MLDKHGVRAHTPQARVDDYMGNAACDYAARPLTATADCPPAPGGSSCADQACTKAGDLVTISDVCTVTGATFKVNGAPATTATCPGPGSSVTVEVQVPGSGACLYSSRFKLAGEPAPQAPMLRRGLSVTTMLPGGTRCRLPLAPVFPGLPGSSNEAEIHLAHTQAAARWRPRPAAASPSSSCGGFSPRRPLAAPVGQCYTNAQAQPSCPPAACAAQGDSFNPSTAGCTSPVASSVWSYSPDPGTCPAGLATTSITATLTVNGVCTYTTELPLTNPSERPRAAPCGALR